MSIDPIRIKDNDSNIDKSKIYKISNLVDRIVNKTIKDLSEEGAFVFPNATGETENLTDDQILLSENKGNYSTGNILGFLGYNDEQLIVQSRFYHKNDDFFIQYLLNKVLSIPNLINFNTIYNNVAGEFDYLIYMFPYYLNKAMRKGPFKKYVLNKYNDSNFKGKIDFNRHLNINVPFIGNIAYNVREFSYDNYLMELIRHTIELIKTKPYGSDLLFNVKDNVQTVVNATPKFKMQNRSEIIKQNRKNIIRHAYYKEYFELQRLCLMILQNQYHTIGIGNNQIYGMLFDGSWLWEEYINTLICTNFYHTMNKIGKNPQQLFKGENRKCGLIYPDYIGKKSSNRIIADAKYKTIQNINGRDYQQILAYMYRFDSKKGFFIYPDFVSSSNKTLFLNKGVSFENNVEPRNDIYVKKIPFVIPEASNYNDFILKMNASEKDFLNNIDCEIL